MLTPGHRSYEGSEFSGRSAEGRLLGSHQSSLICFSTETSPGLHVRHSSNHSISKHHIFACPMPHCIAQRQVPTCLFHPGGDRSVANRGLPQGRSFERLRHFHEGSPEYITESSSLTYRLVLPSGAPHPASRRRSNLRFYMQPVFCMERTSTSQSGAPLGARDTGVPPVISSGANSTSHNPLWWLGGKGSADWRVAGVTLRIEEEQTIEKMAAAGKPVALVKIVQAVGIFFANSATRNREAHCSGRCKIFRSALASRSEFFANSATKSAKHL